MGCMASVPSEPTDKLRRVVTLTTTTNGLVKQLSLRTNALTSEDELLLSKTGVHYTILGTRAVIDIDTCDLIGFLKLNDEMVKESNEHVKQVSEKYKLTIQL